MDQNSVDTIRFSILKNKLVFNLIMPVFIISLLIVGWIAVNKQVGTLTQATIAAYQKAELEIVRAAARSIILYIKEQANFHHYDDITRVEQNIFNLFIKPIRLLKNGDAWIYAPDHVVFDLSEDFPDEYRGKSMDQIFHIQKKMGASHFEDMAAAVMNSQEGVGWYTWLPDKGREIAAWTPVKVGKYTWSIGLSIPLPEILEYTGAGKQIRAIKLTMSIATVAALFFLAAWGYGTWVKEQVEQELKQREKSLRFTQFSFDNAAIGIYYIGSDAKISNVNKQAADNLGYTIEELSQMSIFDIDPLVNEDNWEGIWQNLCNLGRDKFETIHKRKDGKEVPVEISSNLLEYEEKKFSIAFVFDMTERKQAEDKLRKSEEKYRLVMESSPDPTVVYDMDGNVVYINPAFTKVFGWTFEELQGKKIDYVPEKERLATQKMLDKMLRGEAYQGFETRRLSKNGDILDINMSFNVYQDNNGKRTGSIVILRDVTAQKKTQELLIQSEKMLTVGRLAAGMAHEINNPLAGMIQNANVIKSRLKRIDMPANLKTAEELGVSMADIMVFMEKRNIFQMIDAILKSGARAAEIVKSMLSFVRKSDTSISSHYPDQLMDQLLEIAATEYDLKKQYDFKSIEIIKEYADNLPMLLCDGAKIQQVLLNILRNGAQAMHGAKTESPKFILRIYSKGEPEMVYIEIEDNGPGMDEKTRSKVFDPFFTTKPVGIGTGLGLSVSYFIITENHKGKMDVISEPGKGATFIIRLPVDKKN